MVNFDREKNARGASYTFVLGYGQPKKWLVDIWVAVNVLYTIVDLLYSLSLKVIR